jgi:hypothetical protein
MSDRNSDSQNFEIEDLIWNQILEFSILKELGLSNLSAGGQVIRNEKGWRENEIYIDYIWIVRISHSFVGSCGIITVKFNSTNFRENKNPEELIRCIFMWDNNGKIRISYKETDIENFDDPISELIDWDLFNANRGITLDGISYQFHVISNNINTIIKVNNPNSPTWKNWEKEIFELGKKLSLNSKNNELIRMFTMGF